jgi:hypothetical protein
MTAPARPAASTRAVAPRSVILVIAAALAFAITLGVAAVVRTASAPVVGTTSTPDVLAYSCLDAQGRVLASPIPCQCRRPALSPDESSPIGPCPRVVEIDEERPPLFPPRNPDITLLSRYPDKAHYDQGREAGLAPINDEIRKAQARLADLKIEQKLLAENDPYPNKPFPPKLRAAIDTNDAEIQAMKTVIANLEGEAARIAKLYNDELARLRVLWGQNAKQVTTAVP